MNDEPAPAAGSAVQVIAPRGIDDPSAPSGGNVYDRRLCRSLVEAGWEVREHLIGDGWPECVDGDLAQLGAALRRMPDGDAVIVDGLIASAAPALMRESAQRLRLAVLVHLPFGVLDPAARPGEARMLDAAGAVIATSRWTREWLVRTYGLPASRIAVAEPGADPSPLARGSADGGRLLCVGAATPNKAQDVLLAALGALDDLRWTCVFAGPDRDPAFAQSLRSAARAGGIADRVSFVGALSRARIADAYADADLVVVPSRHETYGMVITEALACGLPVIASDVGGTRAAMGQARTGEIPGRLVPVGDQAAMSAALRDWLADPRLRSRLRRAAGQRREDLPDWATCAASVSRVLIRLRSRASQQPDPDGRATR